MICWIWLAVLASSPSSAVPALHLPALGIRAPLGRLEGTVTGPATGGQPANEKIVEFKLPGCEQSQLFWLSRFVAAATDAGEQIQRWIDSDPKLERRLFKGKRSLSEAIIRARKHPFLKEGCAAVREGWQVESLSASTDCKGVNLAPAYGFGDLTGLSAQVAIFPGEAPGAACRPRISAVLFDGSGEARLRYHADYGGNLTVQLAASDCRVIDFKIDVPTQVFVPTLRRDPGCRPRPTKD